MTEVRETRDAKLTESDGGERRLNQFVIQRVLGSGSFGVVHLGIDTDNQCKVAIKEFSKTKLRKQQAMKSGAFFGAFRGRGRGRGRGAAAAPPADGGHAALDAATLANNPIDLVRSEIAILKKLKHRNVVKLFEVLDDPNQDSLFMVFELCERGSLMDVNLDSATQPLDIDTARRYLREMLLGIEYLHEHDIAHRDIKPDNMLIAKDGTLKIVDFGVSEMFTKESGTVNKSAGSPAFYAPEMCVARHGELSGKALDIWAIGVTLYCMIYGRLPFHGNSLLTLYENIRTLEPEYPADIDPTLKDLLTKLLDKNPETRISMDDFRQHPWVTNNNKEPLMCKEENCMAVVMEITQSEVDAAIKPINSIFTVLKAVSKLKNRGKQNGSVTSSEFLTASMTLGSMPGSPTP